MTSGKLWPVSTCSTGNGTLARPERLRGEVQHDDGVLAAGEQQHRPLELGDDLADDVDGLALEQVELVEAGSCGRIGLCLLEDRCRLECWCRGHRCSPHSVFASPAQRPDRGSSPALTGFVHGAQPMEG